MLNGNEFGLANITLTPRRTATALSTTHTPEPTARRERLRPLRERQRRTRLQPLHGNLCARRQRLDRLRNEERVFSLQPIHGNRGGDETGFESLRPVGEFRSLERASSGADGPREQLAGHGRGRTLHLRGRRDWRERNLRERRRGPHSQRRHVCC